MNMHMFALCFVAVVTRGLQEVSGAKILALLTLTTHSHHIWNGELTRALANRGHVVTVLSPDADFEPIANLTYIQLEGSYEFIRSLVPYEVADGGLLFKMRMVNEWVMLLCDYQLSTGGAKELFNYPDGKLFDLIIVESEYTQCFWPFISKFGNPPVVALNGAGIPRRANYMTGSPKNPAYTPDYMLPLPDKMDFMQRIECFVGEIIGLWLWKFEYVPNMQAIISRHFSFPVPSLEQYEQNISLILSNTVFGYDPARPITPSLIPVGGMHLKPAKPLAKYLQEFLDDAVDGAIFFSLGSNLKSSLLPTHVLQSFLEAFTELPQRVLWKFESDNLQHKPDNVMLGKWLPQRDILGHKNIKLFITHNGLMSSVEAAYFGVPTLGIPFFLDQHKNMERARTLGTGDGLRFDILDKKAILKGISQILTNTSYEENARRMSAVFRDQIDHPLDRAVYWVEYVLRHNGAPHLKSAAVDMPLYQYLLLDVIAVLLVALVLSALVLRTMVLYLWRLLSLLRPTAKKDKTQ